MYDISKIMSHKLRIDTLQIKRTIVYSKVTHISCTYEGYEHVDCRVPYVSILLMDLIRQENLKGPARS